MTEPIKLELTLKELQQIDKYIEINEDTYSVLMKIKDAYPPQKSPVEEAYKDVYNVYPPTTPTMCVGTGDIRWRAFQKGWDLSKGDFGDWGDISKVLIEGDTAYIMGEKYQRVEEPVTELTLKKQIKDWHINSYVGQSSDVLANEIVDNVVKCWLKTHHREITKYDADYVSGWMDCIETLEGDLR